MATILSFGWARTLIAHERSSLLSFGSNEIPISIFEGAEWTIVSKNWPTIVNQENLNLVIDHESNETPLKIISRGASIQAWLRLVGRVNQHSLLLYHSCLRSIKITFRDLGRSEKVINLLFCVYSFYLWKIFGPRLMLWLWMLWGISKGACCLWLGVFDFVLLAKPKFITPFKKKRRFFDGFGRKVFICHPKKSLPFIMNETFRWH